jgi:DNA-binding transcriptional regulator YiaG
MQFRPPLRYIAAMRQPRRAAQPSTCPLCHASVRGITAAQLRALRAKAGWTQPFLASYLGVHRNTLNRWEMGTKPIAPEHAHRLWQIQQAYLVFARTMSQICHTDG